MIVKIKKDSFELLKEEFSTNNIPELKKLVLDKYQATLVEYEYKGKHLYALKFKSQKHYTWYALKYG